MTGNRATNSYQQASAHGVSPIGLVISLYDTILRDFRRALVAMDNGDIETRVFEINHALTVVAHLQSVLDHERGGDAAKRLDSFYDVTRAMILEASVHPGREPFHKLIQLYSTVRDAWSQAEKRGGEPAPSPAVSAPVAAVPVMPPRPSFEPSDAPTSGRWSA